MSLIQIGKAGTIAARRALETTAQNIANADNPTYTRRTLVQGELVATGTIGGFSSTALSGVRIEQIARIDATYLQNEARRTNSDFTRVDAEFSGLRAAEAAIEQSGLFGSVVEFEATLAGLASDPLDGALRSAALEAARTLTETFGVAERTLAAAGDQLRFEAGAEVDAVNIAAAELARINTQIIRTEPGSGARAALLDQRDARLTDLSDAMGISVDYAPDGSVAVRIGDGSGPLLVSGNSNAQLALDPQADGTIRFVLDASAVTIGNGGLAGRAAALVAQRDAGAQLDALAAQLIQIGNDAQAAGVAADGSPGQPLFSGSDAGSIDIALSSASGLATAPAGAPANSRDTANLDALRAALADNGPAAGTDRLLFDLSSRVNAKDISREALDVVAQTAQTALVAQTGVDLDAEAVNLVRFQQAFQASGRVIQAANDIFDTILGIR